MNLRQLEQFVAVAETESFSRGAERAHSSQPALSTAISKLESELGVRLLHRRTKIVTLTTDGQRLLRDAKRILADCDAVRVSFRSIAQVEDLRVGVCETLNLARLAPVFEQFRGGNAHVRLHVREASTLELSKRLLANDIDAAFLVTAGVGDLGRGINARLLKEENYRLVVPDDHALGRARSASVAVLDGASFVARTHCEYRPFLATLLSERQIRPCVIYRTAQDGRALDLIRAGLGLGIFPESLIPTEMHALAFEDHKMQRKIYLARRNSAIGPATTEFLEFMGQTRLF